MLRRGARWAVVLIAIFSLLLQQSLFVLHTKADADLGLLSPTPGVTKLADISSDNLLSKPACNQTKINVVRSVLNNFITNEEQHCMYTTLYGLTDGSIIQPNGFGKAYPISIASGGNPFLQPIPNHESMLYEVGDRSFPGVDIGLYKNFYEHLHFNYFYQRFDLTDSPDLFFRYSDNRQISFNTIHFSMNGDYVLADMPHQGFVRIDLSTLAMKPVASALPLINNSGLLGAATTIDNEGRYAAIAYASPGGWGSPFLKIIDTQGCDDAMPATAYDTLVTHCPVINDMDWLQQKISNLQTVQGVAFESQAGLLFDAALADGTFVRYELTPGGLPASREQYLAMGDSYIAGEGAFSYRDGTDTSENKCHQSTLSYPYLIGAKLFDSFASVACSGAVMDNIIGSDKNHPDFQVHGGKTEPSDSEIAQAQATDLPGVVLQNYFSGQDNPNVITISIGGNDVGFGDIIKRCILPFDNFSSTSQNCYQTYEDRLELVNTINNQFNNLVSTYKSIMNNDPTRHIYIIGYPQVVSPTGNCGVNVRLSAADRLFANQLISYLDLVIQKAAQNAGVSYIDTQQALAGHELCEDGAPAMNGLTAGNDKLIIGNESYHPNTLGQQLLGDTILAKTHNLTDAMPAADTSISAPAVNDSLTILQAPKVNRTIYNVVNAGEDIKTFVSGGVADFTVDQLKGLVNPNSSFTGVLHSEPINLGIFKTDTDGSLSTNFTIPTGTVPGFHTMHFYGTDLAGSPIDIQQTVYIRASTTDADGDGVPDDRDSCKYLVNSGADADKDGIDDVCDVLISNTPATSANQTDTEQESKLSDTNGSAIQSALNLSPVSSTDTTPITGMNAEEKAPTVLGVASAIGTAARTYRHDTASVAGRTAHLSIVVVQELLLLGLVIISLVGLLLKKPAS